MSENVQLLNDSLESLYVRWVWGPRTNLYRIGGDPLIQINFCEFFFFLINADNNDINGKYVVGDPLTQLKLIK